jgi:putative mRNA 3-end processing factor
LQVRFLGGAGEVGRSGILLEGEQNILFDYGIKVEGAGEYPLVPEHVDAFILSHSHLDHSGAAPILYKREFPVAFGTAPTQELTNLLIEDALKISMKEGLKRRYSRRDFKSFLQKYRPHSFGSDIEFGDYDITLHDAGHISGSAMALLENRNDRRLLYTGDFKLSPQFLQKGAERVKSDILITESTYATKEHPDRDHLVHTFVSRLREVVNSGGIALLPVFAVGRAQEMLAMLEKYGLADTAYLDGMAKKATEIVMRHPEYIQNSGVLEAAIGKAGWVQDNEARKRVLTEGNIILTTAGMLNGGPVLNYIRRLNKNSMIFLTGYQVEGTNGRRLMEGKPLVIDGKHVKIETPFEFYDFSAHAGRSDLHDFIKSSSPETIMCVHGDAQNAESMAEDLRLEGFEAYAPKVGESIPLDF